MADVIWGTVSSILDENTFVINVTQWERTNKAQYGPSEQVRIIKIEVPEVPESAGERSKDKMEQNLKGRFVRCEVKQRDDNGYLLSKVKHAVLGGY